MSDILHLFFAYVLGLFLGGLFFAGLWFTVKKAVNSTMPLLWFLASFFIRASILLIGFYTISHGNWQKFIVCLVGFITARFIVMRFTQSYGEKQTKLKNEEVRHET